MADVPPEAELEDDGRLLITSEDFYYDTQALPATAPLVLLNDIAAQERVAQETDFQERLHRKNFGEDDLDYTTETRKRRAELLSSKTCAENDVLQFATGSEVHQVSLLAAATHCDLCFNFVRSKLGGQCNDARSSIGLDQFSSSSVASFCSILSAYESMLTQQTERTCDVAAAEVTEPPYVTAENVLELLEIMHYLQSTVLLHSLSNFIEDKVDTSNCGSILILADRFALPNLFEASVSHMTSSLDDIKKDECWEDFPSHLQNRLLTLRAAVCSSILGRGTKSKVFFSSSEEFLAIFSDNLRDQRERLREAEQRQAEILAVRGETPNTQDAAIKIERQRKRIKVLQTFYAEQVRIFRTPQPNKRKAGRFEL